MVSFSVLEQQEMGAERLLGQVVATHASSMYRKTPNWKQNKETFAPHPEKFNWRICRFFYWIEPFPFSFSQRKNYFFIREQHRSRKCSEVQLQQDQNNCLKVSSTMTEEEEEPGTHHYPQIS